MLGMKADPERDRITVDGRELKLSAPRVTVLLHKPKGYLSTARDPHGRPKVTDLVSLPGVRLFPVGRLDRDTSGLLLLTNDGELANLLTHPRYGVWKTYRALVRGRLGKAEAEKLRSGVEIAGGRTLPARLRILRASPEATLAEISLREGRKRQVKQMFAAVGHPVLELARVRLGFLTLDGLRPGEYRFLTEEEVARLKKLALEGQGQRVNGGR